MEDKKIRTKKLFFIAGIILLSKVMASILISWAVAASFAVSMWAVFVFLMGVIMLWNIQQIVDMIVDDVYF